jgi:PhnB protein
VTAGAQVRQPPADMFWGDRHGQLEDPFGHRWNIVRHLRDVPHDEVVAAGATDGVRVGRHQRLGEGPDHVPE